jgi:hypothetical protein
MIDDQGPIGEGIVADEIIRLSSAKGNKKYPIDLRRVTYVRAEDQKNSYLSPMIYSVQRLKSLHYINSAEK